MSTPDYVMKTITDMLGNNGFMRLGDGTYRDGFNPGNKVLVEVVLGPEGKEQLTLKAVRDESVSDIIANHDFSYNSVPESVIEFLKKYHKETRSRESDAIFHYA